VRPAVSCRSGDGRPRHNQLLRLLLLLLLLLLPVTSDSDAVLRLYQVNGAHKASNYCVINS